MDTFIVNPDYVINQLKKDAQGLYELYAADFKRYDNFEDMTAMNKWSDIVGWLDSYREQFYDWSIRNGR